MHTGDARVPFLKHPLSRYVIFGIAAIALGIGAVVTVNWLEYCQFLFGLSEVIYKDGDSISNVRTIGDLKRNVCKYKEDKNYIQSTCPKFCDYVKNLQEAGEVMKALGIVAVVLVGIAIVAHILVIRGRTVPRLLMSSLIVLPCVFWIIGMIVYCSIVDFSHIKGTKDNGYFSAADWSLEASFYVGIIESTLLLAMTVLGLYSLGQEHKKTSQASQPLNQY